jgi:hypothetical protein
MPLKSFVPSIAVFTAAESVVLAQSLGHLDLDAASVRRSIASGR